MVSEAAAEYVDSTLVNGILLDSDLHLDRMVLRNLEVRQGNVGNRHSVDIGAFIGDAPILQEAVLRTFELPPQGRKLSPSIAVVSG